MLGISSDISDIVNINCLFNGSISCQDIMLVLSTLTLYLAGRRSLVSLTPHPHTPITAMFSYLINQHLAGQYLKYETAVMPLECRHI